MKIVSVLSFALLIEKVISDYTEYDLNQLCSDDHGEFHALLREGILIRIPAHFQSEECLVTVYTAPSLNIALAAEYVENPANVGDNKWNAKIFFTSDKKNEVIDFHSKQRQQLHPSFKIFNSSYLNYSDIFYEYDWTKRGNLSFNQTEETAPFLSLLMEKTENYSDNKDYTSSLYNSSYISIQNSTEMSSSSKEWSDMMLVKYESGKNISNLLNNPNDTKIISFTDNDCHADEFQCRSYNLPHCINSSFKCDGHVNCATVPQPDDEMNCSITIDFHGIDVTQLLLFQSFSFISTVLLIMSVVLLLLLIISLLKVRKICLQKNLVHRSPISVSSKNLTFEIRSSADHDGIVNHPPSYDSLFVNQAEEKNEKRKVNQM